MKTPLTLPGPTVVSEKPYRFVPPRTGNFWPRVFAPFVPHLLARQHGILSWEIRGVERVKRSITAGHGVMLVPNHPSPSDPVVLALASRAIGKNLHVMASAHLFLQSRLHRWLLPRLGVFSVYREGMDRESLKAATEILGAARRPLVIFGEGVITRANDRLVQLQDGLAFIARSGAKLRSERVPGGRVVVHPLALRYHFHGDLEATLAPVLDQLELRLSWQSQRAMSVHERVVKIGHALLALKEVEYFGSPSVGSIPERLSHLLDGVLLPLEREWLNGRSIGTVIQRVKTVRKAILPALVAGEVDETERARRWKHLYDLQVAEQIFHFPPDYLGENPSAERLIETVHRYAEAMGFQELFVARPMSVTLEFGEAITVDPIGDRSAASDPLMESVRTGLTSLLESHSRSGIP
jgi:1-acyl-sn-glycerol-3-phosphate acyltransferase